MQDSEMGKTRALIPIVKAETSESRKTKFAKTCLQMLNGTVLPPD